MEKNNFREIAPELAESFEIEFLTVKAQRARDAMREIGDFIFDSSGTGKEEREVYFEGKRRDGTKIKIIIEKGKDYKSQQNLPKNKQKKSTNRKVIFKTKVRL